MPSEPNAQTVTFEVIPHPRYRDRQFAISYAEWLAREMETAEIRVYNRDGCLVESRTISKAGQ